VGADPLPEIRQVYSDAADDCVATKIDPDDMPCVVILADGASKFEIDRKITPVDYRGTDVPLIVAYCASDTDVISSRIASGYVLEALVDSLWALSTKAKENKGWGQTHLVKFTDIKAVRASGKLGSAQMYGAILALAEMHRVSNIS
jgi:hypothetical protein